MTDEAAARLIVDEACGHRLRDMSLFSYEMFLEKGRGLVEIYYDESREDRFNYRYSTFAHTADYFVDLNDYDPEREFYISMIEKEGRIYNFVYRFLDVTSRPAYLHELKTKVG
jgi:hypothetical protein